jgi:hypothetical protein
MSQLRKEQLAETCHLTKKPTKDEVQVKSASSPALGHSRAAKLRGE